MNTSPRRTEAAVRSGAAPDLLSALSGRSNGLGALRLTLAALVLVSHSWELSGHGEGPRLGGDNLGSLAVAGFFAISGYLITGSRLTLSLPRFLWHRFLRVFPGYWAVLLVMAFVMAPLIAWAAVGEVWTAGESWRFVWMDVTTRQRALEIPGTLLSIHPPSSAQWNRSLWTLPVEVECYVIVGLALTVKRLRRPLVGLLALGLLSAGEAAGPLITDGNVAQLCRLGAPFAAGAFLRLLGHRVPVRGELAVLSAGWCVAAALEAHLYSMASLPMAYLVLWAGARWRTEFGHRTDISYGVYIYAYPVQQLLADLKIATGNVGIFAVTAAAIVTPLALTSWFVVERPSLRAKRWTPRWPGAQVSPQTALTGPSVPAG